jgi:hypothetical protein
MFFFFFKHTEYERSHHSKIEGAVKGTRSNLTGTGITTNEFPVEKTDKASHNSTDYM